MVQKSIIQLLMMVKANEGELTFDETNVMFGWIDTETGNKHDEWLIAKNGEVMLTSPNREEVAQYLEKRWR